MFPEKFFDAGYVFGDVDAYGVVLDFRDADFPAIFEPAELLELLNFFEFALGQGWVFEQGVALEDVQSEMFPVFDVDFLLGVADPRDRRAGKIKTVVFEVEDCFYDIGIHDVAGVADGRSDGGNLGGGFFEERGDRSIDRGWIDERFIALDVYEDVAILVRGHFGDAFGAGAVIATGHAGFATEGSDGVDDALVVGGDYNMMNGLGLPGAFVDALDHGFACERDERLAGKARGGVSRGNDHYDFWLVRTHRKFLGIGATLPMLTQSFGRRAIAWTRFKEAVHRLLPSEGRVIMMWNPRGHPGEPGGWGSRETRWVQDSRSVRTGCRPAVQLPLSGSKSKLAPSPGAIHFEQSRSAASPFQADRCISQHARCNDSSRKGNTNRC